MPSKINLEQFLKKANEIHNCKYDYSKFIYAGSNSKGIIICPKHGEFLQIAGNHLRGNGCNKCKNGLHSEKSKLSKEEFIKRSNKRHESKYDYSNFIYINNVTKGVVTCPKHGEFLQTPANHMRGRGCPQCMLGSLDEFIEISKKTHNNKYNYSKFIYIRSHIKGIIICPKHGEFLQTPSDHQNGHGCPVCKADNTRKRRFLGLDKFIERANKIHNNKYDYSKFVYLGNHIKGIITCPIHGEFLQVPSNHLHGWGCKKCSYIYSNKCQDWIKSLNNENIINSFEIKVNNRRFEFDGFDPTTNTVYEFYGDLFHGNPEIYNPDDKIFYGKTFGYLYKKIIERELFLKNAGFKLITIWENEFDRRNK
ncbi:MAG: hypothetical protein WC516_05335 [Patescibacteria group bacterium]|jgi:sarcosine oxidase delta subunit